MTTTSKTTPQDMPPEGGYGPIQTERVKLRTVMGGKKTIALLLAATGYGYTMYFQRYKEIKKEEIEMRSAKHALLPILIAERDREYLKNIRKNRDYEKELMKNYEGWEVGTYFGEPVYKTIPKEQWMDQQFSEYFVHASDDVITDKINLRHWF